jgi:hypothetical protein
MIAPSVGLAGAGCSSSRSDLFLNPFSRASAHHRPIGTGALYASATAASTRDWKRASQLYINNGTPHGVDMVATTSSDPIRSIAAKAYCMAVKGLPIAVRLPRSGLVTNIQPSPSGCRDGDVAIFDRTNGVGSSLRQFDWRNGNPAAGQYRSIDFRGLGHGTKLGDRVGFFATGIASPFGLLRGFELNTPGRKIEHALQIVLPSKPGCAMMLSRNIVLPATDRDGSATSGSNNTGHIPYGGLLAIPRGVNLDGLHLSEAGRRLAEAVRNYGLYVVDAGGCGSGAIRSDQGISKAQIDRLLPDIRKFYPYVRLVLNNNVLGSPVAGGGTPLAPNCAYNS